MPLDQDTYAARDYRTKCDGCRQYMRQSPTLKSPRLRMAVPHASLCTVCHATLPLDDKPCCLWPGRVEKLLMKTDREERQKEMRREYEAYVAPLYRGLN